MGVGVEHWKIQPGRSELAHASALGNRVLTAKYTLLNAIPKNLFEQFHRAANCFFLTMSCLNFVPQIEALNPILAFVPLWFILLTTMIKDLYEDYRRRRSDKEINALPVTRCRAGSDWGQASWSQLKVGELVRLTNDECIPADIMLLWTSDPEGEAFVDTSNIDGESNLKPRVSLRLSDRDGAEPPPDTWKDVEIEYEPPNINVYAFNAMVRAAGTHSRVGPETLLLRGCSIRNTSVCIGVVVYAGGQTKSVLNTCRPLIKRSKGERMIDKGVMTLIVVMLCCCTLCAVAYNSDYGKDWALKVYFPHVVDSSSPGWKFLTWMVVLQTFVPISLYVSLEVAKLAQAYFIAQDLDMYDEARQKGMQCRALNMAEDLGQIEYVFSDKTGTLTCNKMVFRCCSINGRLFHTGQTSSSCDSTAEPEPDGVPSSPRSSAAAVSSEGGHGFTNDALNLPSPPLMRSRTSSTLRTATSPQVPDSGAPNPLQRAQRGLRGLRGLVVTVTSLLKQLQLLKLRQEAESLQTNSPALVNTGLGGDRVSAGEAGGVNAHAQGIAPLSVSVELQHALEGASRAEPRLFVLLLAVCNTIRVSFKNGFKFDARAAAAPDAPELSDAEYAELERHIRFEAESPDEAALVHAARIHNVTLVLSSATDCFVVIGRRCTKFPILARIAFDSDRKRMTTIIRDKDGAVLVFTKGADATILPLLSTASAAIQRTTEEHMTTFAVSGLRTLCCAYRTVPEQEWSEWHSKYTEATNKMSAAGDALMDALVAELESDLVLLGATGIEDALEPGVPQTIMKLRRAGIKVWMLTGDKLETAVEISRSCGLVDSSMELERLVVPPPGQRRSIRRMSTSGTAADAEAEVTFKMASQISEILENFNQREAGKRCFLVDGASLVFALKPANIKAFTKLGVLAPNIPCQADRVYGERRRCYCRCLCWYRTASIPLLPPTSLSKLSVLLLDVAPHLALLSDSVVLCRATPDQKARIVKIVKTRGMRTLAVGDGANDAMMIREANVGIGICGVEGMQATMASDFAIVKFPHLEKLLLVHGQWCYSRFCLITRYFFWKATFWTVLFIAYAPFSLYSGQYPMTEIQVQFWNLIMTGLPPVENAIFDQVVPANVLMIIPELYSRGRLSKGLSLKRVYICILWGFYDGIVIFFIVYNFFIDSDVGIWQMGTMLTEASMYTANLWVLVYSSTVTKYTVIAHVFPLSVVALYYTIILGTEHLPSADSTTPDLYGLAGHVWSEAWYYECLFLCVGCTTGVMAFGRLCAHYFHPSPAKYAAEIERMHRSPGGQSRARRYVSRLRAAVSNVGKSTRVVTAGEEEGSSFSRKSSLEDIPESVAEEGASTFGGVHSDRIRHSRSRKLRKVHPAQKEEICAADSATRQVTKNDRNAGLPTSTTSEVPVLPALSLPTPTSTTI